MTKKKYVPLNIHTDNSILTGFGTIKEYVSVGKELGFEALGLSDISTMTGVYDFVKECQKNGIKPIVGEVFRLVRDSKLQIEDKKELAKASDYDYYGTNLTIYAKNKKGLSNLVKLETLSWEDGRAISVIRSGRKEEIPRIDFDLLREYSEGLIILSGDRNSKLVSDLNESRPDEAYAFAQRLKDLFKEDFYIEITPNVDRNPVEKLLLLSDKMKIPYCITSDAYYARKKDYKFQEYMMAIRDGAKMSETASKRGGARASFHANNHYLKTYDEMIKVFGEELEEGLANTLKIAESVDNIVFRNNPALRPHPPIPPQFKGELEYIQHLINKGFSERRGNASEEVKKESKKRIRKEMEVLMGGDFISYFLVVYDYIRYAKENGIGVGAGRGSAGGSEVAYLLYIHDTDPIRHDLLFERFLSPGRFSVAEITFSDGSKEEHSIADKIKVERSEKEVYIHELEPGDKVNGLEVVNNEIIKVGASPDVDTDFNTKGRADVIDYVTRTYGEDKVAALSTLTIFKNKSVLKDICKIFNVSFYEANKVTNLVNEDDDLDLILDPKNKGSEEWNNGRELRKVLEYDEEAECYPEKWWEIVEGSLALIGRIRGTGVHPCGYIISSEKISDVIPTRRRLSDNMLLTGWLYGPCEDLGLIKMDFLGLITVNLIEGTVKNIEETTGKKVNMLNLINGNLLDKKTFELFQNIETETIFQFSGDGVRDLLYNLHPEELNDLAAVTAIFRPGPMGLNYHLEYPERKNGTIERIPVDNEFKGTEVEELLSETQGMVIYQEQVMRIAQNCAGFTPQEADTLRKAMGKKDMDVMLTMKPKFINGIIDNTKVSERAASKLWEGLEGFAKYAFNRSHSISYALNAYQAGFLKAHFPKEYMASALSERSGSAVYLPKFINEAYRMGLKVKTPDINSSKINISPISNENAISYGLGQIKKVGAHTASSIIEEREKNGKFTDIRDFVERCQEFLTPSTLVYLAEVGSFDSLGVTRQGVVEAADDLIHTAKDDNKLSSNFALLPFGNSETKVSKLQSVEIGDSEYSYTDKLAKEAEYFGVFLSGHPLSNLQSFNPAKMDRANSSYNFKFYGTIMELSDKRSKSGGRTIIMQVEDSFDSKEAILYPKNREKAVEKFSSYSNSTNGLIGEDYKVELEEFKSYIFTAHGKAGEGRVIIDDVEPLFLDEKGLPAEVFDILNDEGYSYFVNLISRVKKTGNRNIFYKWTKTVRNEKTGRDEEVTFVKRLPGSYPAELSGYILRNENIKAVNQQI